jgi:hypothetical protein
MATEGISDRLRAYEVYVPDEALGQRLFPAILTLTLALFLLFGVFLKTIKPLQQEFYEKITQIQTRFIFEEKKAEEKKVEKKPEKPAAKKEPVDLTKEPQLAQKEDDIAKQPPKEPPKARRVYGLRKVYSTGLGAGGSMADAVIGKLGNTLNKDVDTLTARPRDLKGEVVSVTTITSAPAFRKRVKPEYTKEMLDNKVEGVVKVKVLVDIDGRVKQAIALDDLGFGSADLAVKACYQMEFEPARRGDEAVAVWIIVPIRFVLLG